MKAIRYVRECSLGHSLLAPVSRLLGFDTPPSLNNLISCGSQRRAKPRPKSAFGLGYLQNRLKRIYLTQFVGRAIT